MEGCDNIKAMLHVARALIRSRVCYGQEAFFAAPRRFLDRLQAKECSVLRLVLGLPNGAPQELVYREAGWLPLGRERELRCAQYIARAQAVENSTSDEIQIGFDNTHSVANVSLRRQHHTIAERNLSVANYVERISVEAGTETMKIIKSPVSPIPPWLLEKPKSIVDYSSSSKKDNPLLIGTHAKELINGTLQNHLHIFTDGSKQDTGQVGCAFTIPALKTTRSYRLTFAGTRGAVRTQKGV